MHSLDERGYPNALNEYGRIVLSTTSFHILLPILENIIHLKENHPDVDLSTFDDNWKRISIIFDIYLAHISYIYALCQFGLSSSSARRPHSLLLCGPAGTGKTLLMESISKQLSVPLILADASHVLTKCPGHEQKGLDYYIEVAKTKQPCLCTMINIWLIM